MRLKMPRSRVLDPCLWAGFFSICLVLVAAPCAAQEAEAPGGGRGPGSIFAPTGYVQLTVPVQSRVAVNLYGFYIGELGVPIALAEVPIKATKFLTITPGYLYVAVPASGLNLLAPTARGFTRTYQEHQFRAAGTVRFSLHGFAISDRNMYVRRFRPADDINRYRNRIQVAYPLEIKGHSLKPFVFDEGFYDRGHGGWIRNWASAGIEIQLAKHVAFQPFYVRQTSRGFRDINFFVVGLIFTTNPLLPHRN